MKIAVNTRLLLKGRMEGIGWFTYETLRRITRSHPEHDFLFLFDRPYDKTFIFSDNVTPIVIKPQARHPVLFYLWFEFSVRKILKKHKADLFLSPDGYSSLSSKVKKLIVIHDINFHHRPKELPYLIRKYYNYFFPRFAKNADRIATVSEYSKRDIAKSYSISPLKIDVLYNGANELYKPLKPEKIETIKQKYTGGNPYFIFIGSLLPRKNIVNLLKSFDRFKKSDKQNFQLLIVGAKMFKTSNIEKTYNELKHQENVVFTGRLTPENLRHVLGAAYALCFVPFFEGFGIPILEAMYCDVPVITANCTSMPEVAGDAAIFVEPNSVSQIAGAMLKLSTDTTLRQTLIKKGQAQRQKFSWDKTADNLWNSIKEVGIKSTNKKIK